VLLTVTAGITYYVAVDGYDGASGPVTLNWDFSALSAPPPPPSPSISINDASVVEGRNSSRNITFTVTLSQATAGTVTVAYATANGTATNGSDYQAKSGTVSFAAGATSRTITVKVYGDRTKEPNETFTVILSNPTGGALIGDGSGVGTIVNDD
jgi:endoglucanase